jgi:hypothetical protein
MKRFFTLALVAFAAIVGASDAKAFGLRGKCSGSKCGTTCSKPATTCSSASGCSSGVQVASYTTASYTTSAPTAMPTASTTNLQPNTVYITDANGKLMIAPANMQKTTK